MESRCSAKAPSASGSPESGSLDVLEAEGAPRYRNEAAERVQRLRGSWRPASTQAQREGMAPIGRPEHLHYMLIGVAWSAYALSAEFELLTGTPANREALVAEHVAALERMFFPRASGEA